MGTRSFEQTPEEGAEDHNSQTAFEVRWSVAGPDIRDGGGSPPVRSFSG